MFDLSKKSTLSVNAFAILLKNANPKLLTATLVLFPLQIYSRVSRENYSNIKSDGLFSS